MPNYRKAVRDQIKAALMHATTGVNAQMAAVWSTYGGELVTVDFAPESYSFVQMYLSEIDIAESQVVPEDRNCALVLYTSSAINLNLAKSHSFAGQVTANIDCYVRYGEGIKDDNTESTCDAAEDAIVRALNAYTFSGGVTWNRQYTCDRQPMQPLANGWQQCIPISCVFDVYVR